MVNAPNDVGKVGGVFQPVEAFLDQIITWRDIGFIHCAMVENHAEYDPPRVGKEYPRRARSG